MQFSRWSPSDTLSLDTLLSQTLPDNRFMDLFIEYLIEKRIVFKNCLLLIDAIIYYSDDITMENFMNWNLYIHSDPQILLGKPIIKGTRLSVDFILELLAEGWNYDQILENYPSLTNESLQAVFAYAADAVKDEAFYSIQ